MDMKQLRDMVNATGLDTTQVDDDMLRELAKAVGIEGVLPASKAELVEYTSGNAIEASMYIRTPNVSFTNANGAKTSVRGCFVRVEAVAQVIENLKLGLELARKKGLVK